MATVVSVRAMRRVTSAEIAKQNAEATMYRVSKRNAAVPGRMMIKAPMKPMTTAAQRRGLTGSPSTGPDSAVMNSGAVKAMEMASASGMPRRPVNIISRAVKTKSARRPWAKGRRVLSAPGPPPRQTKNATGTSPKR